jgi:hypothetical protein
VLSGLSALTMAAAVLCTPAAPAAAQGQCKALLNAAGKAKFRPFTQAREKRGNGAAMADAIANWQRDVSAKYGSQWMLWENAVDKSFSCGAARPGRIGSWFIRCTIAARPCGGGPDNVTEIDSDPPAERGQCSDYRRDRIFEVQRLMNGCDTCNREVDVDGVCGPTTEHCLRQFQNSRFGRKRNLRADGLPHRETVAALHDYCR